MFVCSVCVRGLFTLLRFQHHSLCRFSRVWSDSRPPTRCLSMWTPIFLLGIKIVFRLGQWTSNVCASLRLAVLSSLGHRHSVFHTARLILHPAQVVGSWRGSHRVVRLFADLRSFLHGTAAFLSLGQSIIGFLQIAVVLKGFLPC